ncbi:unnamed protein product [Allacma fusca]|uniref:Band 7 domain-containing protein n=1 Tax=Allacma fusca TaxID=39272 RepID=A0A8J2JGD6_9HEXA|nr:unnamed protein product [Allacma fusca]
MDSHQNGHGQAPGRNPGPFITGHMEAADVVAGDDNDLGSGIIGMGITMLSWLIVVLTFPFSLFFCFKVVQEYERAVIFRLGRLQSGGSKGIFFVLPCIESFVKVDLRTSCFDVPPQEVLTKDSVTGYNSSWARAVVTEGSTGPGSLVQSELLKVLV